MSRASKIFGNPVGTKRIPDTVNRDGYPAFSIEIQEQYVQMLLTNTMGNTFYVKQKDLIAESADIHAQMLNADPGFAAKAIVYARNKGYMRLQPIYGLAMLSKVDSALFKSIFDDVIRTPKDLSDFYAIRGTGGRAVKSAVANWLKNKVTQYWAIKYGSDGNDGFSMKDMLKVSHPVGPKNAIFEYLLGKEYDSSDLNQIRAFEALKRATSDSEKIRLIEEGRLPHEVATTFAGNSKAVWNAIVPQMPLMALLKNLKTLERHEVADANKKLIQDTFANAEIIEKSKILPFRFIEAEKHVNSSWIKDSLRDGLELSFKNIPDISGKTVVFLDASGSMDSEFMLISSIFGIAIMKKTEDGKMITFGERVKEIKVSKRDSLLTQASKLKADQGYTDTSLPFKMIIDSKEKFDNIVLITDGQQNRGTKAHLVFDEYRRQVNRNTKIFVIDVSPYGAQLFDTKDKNIHLITGWSDDALNYISASSNGWGSMIDVIKNSD